MDSSKQRDGLPEEVSPTKKWDPRKKSTCDLSVASTLMMTELNQNLPVRVLEIENDDDDIDSDHPVGFSDGGGKQLSKAQAKNFKNLRKKSTTKRTFFWGKRQDNKKRAKNTRKEKKTPTKSHSSDKPQEQKGKGPPVGGVSMVGQGDLTQLANYIRQAALEKKVASGEITIDEFKRLSAPEQASERGQADKSKRLTLTRSSSRKMEKNISNADSFSEIAAQIRRKKEVYTFNYRTGDIISIRVLSDEHCCLGFLRSKKRRFVVADVPFSTVQNDLNFHFKIFKRDQNAQLPEEELRKTETVFQSMKTKLYLSRPLDKSEVWSEKKPQERESINTQATIWFSYLQDRKDPQPFFLRGDVLNIGITESPLLFEATPIKEANDAQNLSLDVHYGSVAQRPKQTPEEIPRYGTINPPKKKDDSHRKSFSFHRGGKIEKIEREKEKEDLSDFSNIAAKIKEKKRQKGQGGSAIKLQSPPPLPPAPPGPPAPPPPPLPPPVAPLLPLRADSLGDPGSRKESSVRFEVSGALKAPKRGTSRHSQPPMTHAQLTTEMLAAGAEIPKLSTDLRSSSGISLPVPPPPSPSPVVVGRQPSMSPQPVTTPPPPPLPPPSTTSSTNTPPTPPPRTTTPTPHATTRLSTSPLPKKKPNEMTKKLSATTLSKVPPPINVPLPPALGGSSFVSPRGALVPVTPPPAPPLPPALQRENSRVLPCSLSLAKSVSLDPTKEQTPPIIRRGREKTKTPEVKKISSLLVSQISGPLLPPPLSVRAESPLPPPLIVGPAKKPAAPHGLQSFNETPPPIIVDITKVPTTPEIDDRTEQESQPIEKEPKEEREEQEQGEKDKLEERDGEREEEREEEKKKEGEEDITLMGDLSSSFAELDAISGNRPPTETTKVIQEQKEQEQKEQEQREQEQQEQKEQEQREQEQQEQREQEQQEQKEQEQKEQVGITKDHGFDLSGLENYSSFEDGGGVGASMGFDVGGLSFPPHHEGEKSETEGEKSETEERGEGGEGEERGGEGEERGGEGGERVGGGGGGGGEGLSASELLMRDLEMGETSSPLYHPDDALNGSSSSSFGHVSSSGAGFDLAGLLSELDTSSTLLELTTAATNLGLDLGDFGLDNFPKPQDEILEDSSEEEEDSDIDSEEEEEEEEWDETPSKPDPIESGEKVTFLEVDEFDTLCTLEEASRKFEHKEEVFSLRGKNLELLAELGKGSQATVWKCTIDGLLVALKQINLAGAKDKREVRTAVKKEVDLMKNAQHRNVMRYFGSFFSSKTQELNIITEIISGGPLTKWIQTQGCFSDILCAHVLLQTLEGLHFIHSNRILHRDIKPDNLLIDLDGSVKLVDFGIAAQLENEAAYRNSSVGTPWYTAPEVINGDDYSFGCDIWSLGCTLIEMMTGKPPFHHLNAIATLNIMGEEQPTIPTSFSTLARDFLQQIFIRDPRKRPTAAELLQHPFILENLMEDQHSTIFLT